MPNTEPTPLFLLAALGSFLFWTLAYMAMIVRGWKDKTFAEPVLISLINLAWEYLFVFHYRLPVVAHYGNLLWFCLTAVLVCMSWRYGPEDFANPLVKRGLRIAFVPILGLCLFVQWGFVEAYQDYYGKALGSMTGVINAAMFLGMLLRRESIRGQSFYIALFMFLGNVSACYVAVHPFPLSTPPPPPDTPQVLVRALFTAMLPLNIAYVVLTYRQCKREGFNPWRRI